MKFRKNTLARIIGEPLKTDYRNFLLSLPTILVIIIVGVITAFPDESKAFVFGKSKEKYIYECSSKSGLTEAHAGQKLIDGAAEFGWTFVQMTPGPCAVFKKPVD